MTADLEARAAWVTDGSVTHGARERTGVDWKPVSTVLAAHVTVLVVTARPGTTVPGRTTDGTDAQWLADVLPYGMGRASFIPSRAHRDWRDLTRQHQTLVHDRRRVVQRIHTLLHDAKLKRGRVGTDSTGASGRAILAALTPGATDRQRVAGLARGTRRTKQAALAAAPRGRRRPHHRRRRPERLDQLAYLEDASARVAAAMAAAMTEPEPASARRDTMPGGDRRVAQVRLAEVGPAMGRLPPARHLAGWAGLCPGTTARAGHRPGGRRRRGSPWRRPARLAAAHGAARATSRAPELVAWYRRLAAGRGGRKAAVALAVAHKLRGIA